MSPSIGYRPEELGMVTMPILVMAGGKPNLYSDPMEFKAVAEAALLHARVIIVPGAGHGLNMEKPGIVNHQIVNFLETN